MSNFSGPALPVEGLHHPFECPSLRQFVAKESDRVLVRRRPAKIEPQKPHPREPVPNHELHLRIRQIVLRLQDQRLEHRDRVKRRPTAFPAIAIAETFDQPAAEIFEINRRIEHLQRIAMLAQLRQMLR